MIKINDEKKFLNAKRINKIKERPLLVGRAEYGINSTRVRRKNAQPELMKLATK
jgi:hypothetical protein